MPASPLPATALRRTVSDVLPPFETTASLDPLDQAFGQDRAVEALQFAIAMEAEGYNVFVMGPPGVGRHTLVRAILDRAAAGGTVPRDVCYVHDFAHPERPRHLLLPPGRGAALRDGLAQLVTELRTVLPGAFEGDEFQREKQRLEQAFKERHEGRLKELRARAEARGVAVISTPMGFAIAAIDGGKLVEPDEFEKLSPEDKREKTAAMDATREELRAIVEDLPKLQKEARAALRALIQETASAAIRHHIDDLRADWKDEPLVLAHLDAVEKDVRENVDDFLKADEKAGDDGILDLVRGGHRLRRYVVNVLVDHGKTAGAPVVYENHPTFTNLIGRMEHLQQLGALVTDVGLLKAGALHRANGGYLLLDARNLLTQPFAWEGLKRALLSREIRLESPGQAYGLVSTVSLEPEPLPLSVKVVLIGDREIQHLLERFDPDYRALFKVAADFDEDFARTPESTLLYARLLGSVARREGLLPLDRSGVTKALERAVRLAGDTEKLSAQVLEAFDVVREASHLARARGSSAVGATDVEKALDAQERRAGRIRERMLEMLEQGTVMVATDGGRVGQVNALSVLSLGRATFGRPSRVTARVRLGRGEVVDIEREVELGGPIHSKGVLILASLLGARYAPDSPLSLHASLVFEQSYGPIDGDSASCAELCALLSALADVPLRQSIAITGAINQHGEVQAIGGVNEKIEGFYDLCAARGLTGQQGVIVPKANVRHLMLREDIAEAAAAGRFRVWAVTTADEAMELLTELPAGERRDGRFPEGTVNAKVEARLLALWERRMALSADAKKAEGGSGG